MSRKVFLQSMYNMLCQSLKKKKLYIFHLYRLISCLSPLDEGNLEKQHKMCYQRCSESFSAIRWVDCIKFFNQINWDDGLTGVNAFIVELEISERYIWQKDQVPTTDSKTETL